MINLALRNFRLYIRDRTSVLYSLLGVFIIIGLYVLFLGDNMARWVAGSIPDGRFLIDSWLMAGILGVSSFTTTLGALGTLVEDRDRKIDKDFKASPLKRWQIAGGYLASAVLSGFFMCCVTFALAEVYIVAKGGAVLPLLGIVKALGILLLSAITSAAMLFPIVSTVRGNSGFAGISTIAGTLIGFLTGMYIPIGELPAAVQTVMRCFPITHAAALLRQVFTQAPRDSAFAGAPASIVDAFNEQLGITLRFGDAALAPWAHIAVLAGTALVFFALSAWIVARSKR